MTPIADKSGILDLNSLEQFITIEDLKTEALDENWSIGNENQPNYPDKVIIIGGKRWFEILLAVVQTVIKTRTLVAWSFEVKFTAITNMASTAIAPISLSQNAVPISSSLRRSSRTSSRTTMPSSPRVAIAVNSPTIL